MNLRGIVSVSGKPGLYKVIGQNKSGFILESLDGQKLRLVVNMSTAKLASLEDITVFGDIDDLKLIDVFENMKSNAAPDVKNADGKALRAYFREVAPGHDEDRVYSSDIKKIITWFNLIKELPLFSEQTDGQPAETESETVTEEVEAEEKKPAKKAKSAKAK